MDKESSLMWANLKNATSAIESRSTLAVKIYVDIAHSLRWDINGFCVLSITVKSLQIKENIKNNSSRDYSIDYLTTSFPYSHLHIHMSMYIYIKTYVYIYAHICVFWNVHSKEKLRWHKDYVKQRKLNRKQKVNKQLLLPLPFISTEGLEPQHYHIK